MNRNRVCVWLLSAVLAVCWASGALAGNVSGLLVVKQGDVLGGSTVATLNTPFTDGNGRVGFVGSLADSQRFIWYDTGAVFFSGSALPDELTGGEGTMGISNTGGFAYSPSVNGNDAVYTHGGALIQKGDPIFVLPGLYSAFNSRPSMLPNGTVYWVGGTTPTQGSSSATNRHLFLATDPTAPATIQRVLGGGDVVEGKTIKTSATNFDYWISDNGLHHIHNLDMDVTLNEHIYVDGAFVAQEGGPTGQGDNWQSFDIVGINDAGNYIFTGDTDGLTDTDEFVVYNGAIAVREGDTLDGYTLLSGYTLRAASINNNDYVAHIWGSSADEHLFCGYGPALGSSLHLLGVNDTLDVDGDTVPDYVVTDFNASTVTGPGLSLAEDGMVYVEVDLAPVGGGTSVEAIVGIALSQSPPMLTYDSQSRSVSASAYAYWMPMPPEEPCSQSDYDSDSASDFGPFASSVSATAACPETSAGSLANQTSTLGSEIHASGSTSGSAYSSMMGSAGSDASSICWVTFHVTQAAEYTLSGDLSGFGAFVRLSDDIDPPYEQWAPATFSVSGLLLPGRTYTLGIEASGMAPEYFEAGFDVTLSAVPSTDCNDNGLLDECDLDCGEPGGPCDLPDCGQSVDCNDNGVPDECEYDSDGDGVPNDCDNCPDHVNPSQADCDGDGVGDACTIAECAGDPACLDCNENGVPDECDIASGTSEDGDGNGIPDECEAMIGDTNCDHEVNPADIPSFALALVNPEEYAVTYPDCSISQADTNQDAEVDGEDVQPFVDLLLEP